jgi:hypothetical protein
VARLVGELTAKDPAARPASAEEVAARADRLREDLTEGAEGPAAWLYSVPGSVADIPAPGPATAPAGRASRHVAAKPSPSLTPRQSPSPAASAPPAPGTVEVTAAALIGEPVDLVRERLQLLGLAVRVQRHVSRRQTGTVLAVEPSGKVRPASTILVTVAFMLDQRSGRHHHRHHHGDGGGTSPVTGTVADTTARRS